MIKQSTLRFIPLNEPFMAGSDITEDISPDTHLLWKLEGGMIYFCQQGWAQVTINLKDYEITENTQVILMPGSIIRINGISSDFRANYFVFTSDMFHEAAMRLDSNFFGFLSENPCYTLSAENTTTISSLMCIIAHVYLDKENRFRSQIAKNHLQCFLWDIYDKCHRYFSRQQIEGKNRQDEIFKKFMALIHEFCTSEREVAFYAEKLCISSKYLTGICRNVTGDSAKQIIDNFAVLEIKVLLQSTDMTIQGIADKLRFPDQSYLGRYFKRHEGVSPKEYQNRQII